MATQLFPLGANWIDAGLVSTPAETPVSMPVSNLQSLDLSRRVRMLSVDSSETHVGCDLGTPRAVQGVAAIGFSNATTAAQVEFVLASDVAFSTDVVTSGVITVMPSWVDEPEESRTPRSVLYAFDQEYSRQYLRVRLIDPANADGYLDLRRVVVGRCLTPPHSFSPGASWGAEHRGVTKLSEGGQPHTRRLPVGRVLRITMSGLSRRMRQQITEMIVIRDPDAEICVVPSTADDQEDQWIDAIYGWPRSLGPATWTTTGGAGHRHELSLELVERTYR